jgi:hypothetical protein
MIDFGRWVGALVQGAEAAAPRPRPHSTIIMLVAEFKCSAEPPVAPPRTNRRTGWGAGSALRLAFKDYRRAATPLTSRGPRSQQSWRWSSRLRR